MVRLAGNAPAWSCSQGKRVTFTLQPVKSMVHQVRLALTKPCGNRFTAGLICCSETGGLNGWRGWTRTNANWFRASHATITSRANKSWSPQSVMLRHNRITNAVSSFCMRAKLVEPREVASRTSHCECGALLVKLWPLARIIQMVSCHGAAPCSAV